MKISEYIERVFESNPNETPNLPQAPSKTGIIVKKYLYWIIFWILLVFKEKVPYMRHVGPLEGHLYQDIEIGMEK